MHVYGYTYTSKTFYLPVPGTRVKFNWRRVVNGTCMSTGRIISKRHSRTRYPGSFSSIIAQHDLQIGVRDGGGVH